MSSCRTDYTEPKGGTIDRIGWESVLGRLNVVSDEINRALARATRVEDPSIVAGATRTPHEG
jgi:hypothetical protein